MTTPPPPDDPASPPPSTYTPRPFAPPTSMAELRDQAPIVSLLVVAAFVFMLIASAFLPALWWRAMGGFFILIPTLFFLWRFYQNPALLARRLPDLSPRAIRRSLLGLAATLITLQLLQLYWSDLTHWFDRLL